MGERNSKVWSRRTGREMPGQIGLLLFFLVLSACSQAHTQDSLDFLTAVEQEEGWKLLFDGKTLDGWQLATPGTWKAEHGTIAHAEEGGMGAEGMIWTTEQYGNFILDCEFKITPRCNSGIFFRVGDTGDPVQTGFEMQINDSFGRPEHRRGSTHNCGALYDIVGPSHNMAKPAGEWNRAVITCKDNIVSISLNGDQVVSTVDLDLYTEPRKNLDGSENKFDKPLRDFPRKGYIGFQQHGGSVWFRNIKIKEL
jgi:hypothetical protein